MNSQDYQKIFDQSSAIMAIVDCDYHVLAASDGFLEVTLNNREKIEGREIFDVFPKIGEEIEAVLVNTMRESINNVIRNKEPETTPVVRYDIPKSDSEENGFDIRYWRAMNTPIVDENNNVKFIKQIYVDVTDSENTSGKTENEKESLDEYKTAEKYIRKAFKQAPLPICVLRGEDHLVEMVNKGFHRIMGSRNFIGKPVREVLPELEGQGFFEMIDEVYHAEESAAVSDEPIIFNVDDPQNRIYVDFIYQVLHDTNGNKEGVFVLGIDVTEKERARLKLEDSEHKFRTLIEESTVATALYTGPDHHVQYANDKMLYIFDKDKTIFGLPFSEAVPELKEHTFLDHIKSVFSSGETYTGVEEKAELLVNDEPEIFYFNFTFSPLRDADGNVYGVLNTAIDVTDEVLAKRALEKREHALEQLLNSIPQKISHTDENADMVFFNQKWLDETGLTLEDLEGKGWFKTIHPDDTEEAKENWKEAIKSGESVEGEFRIKDRDIGYRWNLNRAVPIKGKDGEVRMWVDSKTDIHDQKKQKELLEKAVAIRTKKLEGANTALIRQNREIEKQKKEMEAFAYVSSHDLQEPLRKIRIFAGRIRALEDQNLSDRGLNYFGRMEEAAERMQVLIEDLLSYSKVKNDKGQYKVTDLNEIINEVKSELREIIEEKDATIKVTEICDAKVIPFQFRQLLKNIISNSLKFSKPDIPPRVIITSKNAKGGELGHHELNPDRTYCHITLKDNGIGFEPMYGERIFKVFQRLHTRDEYAGTGIGLSIVKKIVDNHDGYITATGEPGKGAQFDIYVPYD